MIYKVGDTRCHLGRHALIQHNFFYKIRTPTENKHARIVVIAQQQMQKPMKLSQTEKRIPQTLTNSKDVIQKGREYARQSSRARSTRGHEDEAWALYKKIHPGCPGLTFLGFTKVSHPCWKLICSRAIVHLRQTRLSQGNYMFQCTRENEKKSTCITLFKVSSTLKHPPRVDRPQRFCF